MFRDREVRAEIASLDAVADCQRIAHLLACYEFPIDIRRSLELALFHTYGSVSVSRLLARTGQFVNAGQKRYDDTRLLISHFLESGLDAGPGAQAIARMNAIHGRFRISNDDYIFVLSTFIDFPIAWLRAFGWRALTPHEERAWFSFFREVGLRMGIAGIPESRDALAAFVAEYERTHLVFAASNREIADATIDIMRAWLPPPLRFAVRPAVACLVSERLLDAFGYRRPPAALRAGLRGGLRVRALAMRLIAFERCPTLIAHTVNRTYPGNRYRIEAIGPTPGP